MISSTFKRGTSDGNTSDEREEGKKGREIKEGSALTGSLVSLQQRKKVVGRRGGGGGGVCTQTHTHPKNIHHAELQIYVTRF